MSWTKVPKDGVLNQCQYNSTKNKSSHLNHCLVKINWYFQMLRRQQMGKFAKLSFKASCVDQNDAHIDTDPQLDRHKPLKGATIQVVSK